MRVIAIVQARMGSNRLLGKSLADLAGRPLLWHVLERIKRCETLDGIVLATTMLPEDDVLAALAHELGLATFRGSENDLVDRFYQAALSQNADVIVRVCADNPVVEPAEVDRIVRFHMNGTSDFSSNLYEIQKNGYPDGLGAEVFNFDKLEEVWREATDPRHREHPHTYFYEHPEKYRIGTVACPPEFRRPELVLDVNTEEELAFMRRLFEHCFTRNPQFHITDIIKWYDEQGLQ